VTVTVNVIGRVEARIRDAATEWRRADVAFTVPDARRVILEMCRQEEAERPTPDEVDHLAAVLVQLMLPGPEEYHYTT
jgi:hypothetical protein